ncbi:MAG: DUF3126 family protein [Kiloniellaceae bacterium]
MEQIEIVRVQQYLRDTFGTDRLVLKARESDEGSAEVYIGGEFIGVVYRDEEEGEVSYSFNMAILDIDLPAGPGAAG